MSNGVLSQEEIDALLNTGNVSSEEPPAMATAETVPEPVAAAASETSAPVEPAATVAASEPDKTPQTVDIVLSEMDKDAIGEVGNISMGSAATALSTLLDSRVEITTPQIEVTTYGRLRSEYPLPFLVVDVSYTKGLEGINLLVIRHQDASIIADLMMGNDGSNPPQELSEFHLGAVGEAMNQMMGSSCTAMSSVLGQRIEIGIPKLRTVHLANETLAQGADENETIIKIKFQMQIGNLINSEIMQILPVNFSQQLLADLMENVGGTPQTTPAPSPQQPVLEQAPPMVAAPQIQQANVPPLGGNQPQQGMYPPPVAGYAPPQGGYAPQGGYGLQGGYPPQQGMPQPGYQPQGFAPQQGMYQYGTAQPQNPVNVQPAQFTTLSSGHQLQEHGNIGLIMDVPLQITVELGKTRKTIKEILELGPGSVLELDKLAGEPVDLLVNGKLVAKGEVVVIDENFGVRVTDIVSPIERVANLQ